MVALAGLLFFLSGVAALIYQVAWVRSFSLIFGGSHLAVTTVLSVFMGGLALGARILGKERWNKGRPLALYGGLELGVGGSALLCMGLLHIYPWIYPPLAHLAGDNRVVLSLVRVVFAVGAMLLPATLMGGTLPVLARLATGYHIGRGRRLAALYGLNTLGAMTGAWLSGFVLLQTLGVQNTVRTAVAINVLVGVAALLLAGRMPLSPDRSTEPQETSPAPAGAPLLHPRHLRRLVLLGIGVSGFCALGYEVLWTRMLTMVLGTSVYSFTIMLTAFLAGIALGSEAFELWQRKRRTPLATLPLLRGLGGVQLCIGLVALAVTIGMQALPATAPLMQSWLMGARQEEFAARQSASLLVALVYMAAPALLMGAAFPWAGVLYARLRGSAGQAVGEVLTSNTLGAILGAALSGFALVYALGVERALQTLVLMNIGAGLVLMVSDPTRTRRGRGWLAAGVVAALWLALVSHPDRLRFWDQAFFAIYQNNHRVAFETPEKAADALANTDVLFYAEGVQETISVIRPKGSQNQALLVNSRVEASSVPQDVQCQRTLGHLPMLLHPNPQKVFVLGTGTGMTLGATAAHPQVERIVLAEIEPLVLGATRTFGDYNHQVLDDPRLQVVFDDGRNFLNTTSEKFDVITADPIHPWSGGAAYLYTDEYFRSVAQHLNPGGVACQWLPLYELDAADLRSVLKTFHANFAHVLVWVTLADAELVGSNRPFILDPDALARRLAVPALSRDLAPVHMATVEDFLSYFVAGTTAVEKISRDGVLNTDDNLWLEFHAPRSMGMGQLTGANVELLSGFRDSLAAYMQPAQLSAPAAFSLLNDSRAAGRLYDRAHVLFLWHETETPEFQQLAQQLMRDYPRYAPFRFLTQELARLGREEPVPVASIRLAVTLASGVPGEVEIFAVLVRTGDTRAAVIWVHHAAHDILGERYLDAPADRIVDEAASLGKAQLEELHRAYMALLPPGASAARDLPSREAVIEHLRRTLADTLKTPTIR